MRVCLSGVTGHLLMAQCIIAGIQVNQMTGLVRTVLGYIYQYGMIMAARRSLAISVKDQGVCFRVINQFQDWN